MGRAERGYRPFYQASQIAMDYEALRDLELDARESETEEEWRELEMKDLQDEA